MPIFLERFGQLTTSRSDVLDCLRTLASLNASPNHRVEFTGHLEIETYAWTVLPETMRQRGLAQDIASEFNWLKQSIASLS